MNMMFNMIECMKQLLSVLLLQLINAILSQAGGSTGLLMDLAANEKAVHADFFNSKCCISAISIYDVYCLFSVLFSAQKFFILMLKKLLSFVAIVRLATKVKQFSSEQGFHGGRKRLGCKYSCNIWKPIRFFFRSRIVQQFTKSYSDVATTVTGTGGRGCLTVLQLWCCGHLGGSYFSGGRGGLCQSLARSEGPAATSETFPDKVKSPVFCMESSSYFCVKLRLAIPKLIDNFHTSGRTTNSLNWDIQQCRSLSLEAFHTQN